MAAVRVKAIDVSSYQHEDERPIEWNYVRSSGVHAVLVKATEGTDYVNPWLERDCRGAYDAGLKVGQYHFAHPGQGKPEEQASYFWEQVKGLPRDLCVMLDLEVQEALSWPELSEWGKAFCDAFEGHSHTIVLYSNRDYLENMPAAPWGHKLLFADPDRTMGRRPRRRVWGWQRSWTEMVMGISGEVDLDELWLERA